MPVGEARPGYELWRPNREKPESKTAKFVVVLLLVVSAVIAGLVTICGWSLLQGGPAMGVICLIFYVFLYLLFAYFIARWNRGLLPVASAWAVLLIIFCAVGANSWFARHKPGFDEALIPVPLIGLLVVILIPIQVALMVATMVAFNQEWHVEEERPIGSGEDYGAGTIHGGAAPGAPA
ncbi:MAG: hypothetical protein U0R52_07985 [Solirubrobacterales bacterium]